MGLATEGTEANRFASAGALTDAQPTWGAGARLSGTLGRQGDQHAHDRAELLVDIRERQLDDARERVVRDVRGAWRRASIARQRSAAAAATRQAAEEKLQLVLDSYRTGESTSFQILAYTRDFTDARLAALAAAVDFLDALAELDRVSGGPLPRPLAD